MKKINIFMSRLKYGGMELSLINFINQTKIADTYDVHLYLIYCNNNELLEKIDNKVSIHLLCKKKWDLFNKIITAFKLLFLYIKTPKSDISICYSNHQQLLSNLARKSSDKTILFVHSDLNRYETKEEKESIKSKINFDKFTNIVCVSSVVKDGLVKLYDDSIGDKCVVIPNYVDGQRILDLAKHKREMDIDYKIPTFVNIANHVEKYKNIDLIIESAKKLKKDNLKFQVLLIGSGEDTNHYLELINKYKLNKYILLLGSQANPYQYLKGSRALLFTSRYEGYGMVLDEARVLSVPIITTGSGASIDICNEGYGIVTNNLYEDMKIFIKSKQKKIKDFDYKNHNNKITKSVKDLINEGEIYE